MVKILKSEKNYQRIITLLLFVLLLLLFIDSLIPIQVIDSWTEFTSAVLQQGKGGQMTLLDLMPDVDTVAERLLAFIPLGFLIYQKLRRYPAQHAQAISIGLVVLVALGIEIAQAAISARHSRILDVILAVAAGMVGIKFSSSIASSHSLPVLVKAQRLLPGFLWLGNYLVACICIAAIMAANTDITEWDCHYPLLIGNELTYDRPWQGEIRGLAIYPKELAAEEIRKLSRQSMKPENTSFRDSIGAVALYSFVTDENHHLLIHNHAGPTLELTPTILHQETRQFGNSIPLLIKSTTPADVICQAILDSQAFTIETEIASGDLTQGGPARIVSNSIDLENRNFTLGEQEGDLILRVRTLLNGGNGENIPLITQNNVLASGWKHVIASYANGTAKIFVNGKEAAAPLHYKETLLFGTALTVKSAWTSGVLLLLMGILASLLFLNRPPFAAAVMSFFSTSLVPIISSLTVAYLLARHLNSVFISCVVFIPLLGFALLQTIRKIFTNN